MPFTEDYIDNLNSAQLHFLHKRINHYGTFEYSNPHASLEDYNADLRKMLIQHLDKLPSIIRNELRLLNLLVKQYDDEQFKQLDFESRYYILTYNIFKQYCDTHNSHPFMKYIDEDMKSLYTDIWFIETVGPYD